MIYPSDPSSHPLLTDLVAAWELANDGTDSHTGHHDLTNLNNTITFNGAYATFDGNDGTCLYCASSHPLDTGNASFTIEFWFWTAVNSSENGHSMQPLSKGNSEYGTDVTGLGLGGSVAAWVNNETDANILPIAPAALSQWHQVIFWRDSDAGTFNGQIDQGSIASDTVTGTGQSDPDSASFIVGGAYNSPSPVTNVLDGRMKYLRQWSRVLTDTEHTWLYNSGSGRTYSEIAAYTG